MIRAYLQASYFSGGDSHIWYALIFGKKKHSCRRAVIYARLRPAVANCWSPSTNLGWEVSGEPFCPFPSYYSLCVCSFFLSTKKGGGKGEGGDVIGLFSSPTDSHRPSRLLTRGLFCLSVKTKKSSKSKTLLDPKQKNKKKISRKKNKSAAEKTAPRKVRRTKNNPRIRKLFYHSSFF